VQPVEDEQSRQLRVTFPGQQLQQHRQCGRQAGHQLRLLGQRRQHLGSRQPAAVMRPLQDLHTAAHHLQHQHHTLIRPGRLLPGQPWCLAATLVTRYPGDAVGPTAAEGMGPQPLKACAHSRLVSTGRAQTWHTAPPQTTHEHVNSSLPLAPTCRVVNVGQQGDTAQGAGLV